VPTEAAASLRAGSYAAILLGATMIPLGLVAWLFLAPAPFDARMLVMLAASAVTGLFVINGLGQWVSLFNPRRGNYYGNFGNDLSLFGNVVVIGGVLVCMFVPQLLLKVAPWTVAVENWWFALITMLLGIAFYFMSLNQVAALFGPRREKLLAVVEGRD